MRKDECTPEEWENHLRKQRERRKNETPEQREKRIRKHKEWRENYINRVGKDKYREYNKNQGRKYRSRKEKSWKEYSKEYFKEWLKKPENAFSHYCRCSLANKRKETVEWKQAKQNGKSADHILPPRLLALFFLEKGIDISNSLTERRVLRDLCNLDKNIRFIKKEKNSRGNNASLQKIIKVAKILEGKAPSLCAGITEWIINNENLINK